MLTREEIAIRNDFARSPLRPAEQSMTVHKVHPHFKRLLEQHECTVINYGELSRITLPLQTEKRNIYAECYPTIWNVYILPDGYTFRRMQTDLESIAYCTHPA